MLCWAGTAGRLSGRALEPAERRCEGINLPVTHSESSGATCVSCDREPARGNEQKCCAVLELTKRPLLAPVLASGPKGGNNVVYPEISLAYLFLLLDEALMRVGIIRKMPPRFFCPVNPPVLGFISPSSSQLPGAAQCLCQCYAAGRERCC